MNYIYMVLWTNVTLHHISTVCTLFLCWLIASNFSSIPIVLHRFFSQIGLNDVDLCFSLILLTTATAFEEGTKWAAWLCHKLSQSICMTDGMTAMSLSASFQHKTCNHGSCMPHHIKLKTVTYRLCQIALNRTLSHKFEKGRKFSSHVKVKSRTKRPACTLLLLVAFLGLLHHVSCSSVNSSSPSVPLLTPVQSLTSSSVSLLMGFASWASERVTRMSFEYLAILKH